MKSNEGLFMWQNTAIDLANQLKVALAEVVRLKELVRIVENAGCKCGAYPEAPGCPWCPGGPQGYPHDDESAKFQHDETCPAFTPEGKVR